MARRPHGLRLRASIPPSRPTRSTCGSSTPTILRGAPRTGTKPDFDVPQPGFGRVFSFNAMADYALELLDISCTFRSKDDHSLRYTAVSGTTLRIRDGEFVSVV